MKASLSFQKDHALSKILKIMYFITKSKNSVKY